MGEYCILVSLETCCGGGWKRRHAGLYTQCAEVLSVLVGKMGGKWAGNRGAGGLGSGRMTWGGGAGGEASGTHCPMLTHRQDARATRTGLTSHERAQRAQRGHGFLPKRHGGCGVGAGVIGEVRTDGPRATGHAWLQRLTGRVVSIVRDRPLQTRSRAVRQARVADLLRRGLSAAKFFTPFGGTPVGFRVTQEYQARQPVHREVRVFGRPSSSTCRQSLVVPQLR